MWIITSTVLQYITIKSTSKSQTHGFPKEKQNYQISKLCVVRQLPHASLHIVISRKLKTELDQRFANTIVNNFIFLIKWSLVEFHSFIILLQKGCQPQRPIDRGRSFLFHCFWWPEKEQHFISFILLWLISRCKREIA